MKLSKSTIKTLEMLREDFGEYSLSWTEFFECYSHFKASRVSVEYENVQGDQVPIK
jgi:hypothetical protein